MNKNKIKNLLQDIEKLHRANNIVNYYPTFEIDSFLVKDNLENSLYEFLTTIWRNGNGFTLKLVELTHYTEILSREIDEWLKPPAPFGGSLEPKDKIIDLANEVKEELLSMKNPRVFKVETTHKAWYEASWSDFLFVESDEAYFLHLGVSD